MPLMTRVTALAQAVGADVKALWAALGGLGSAATRNATTSTMDATADSLLQVGSFGIGVQLVMTDPELNNYRAGGKYITPASGLLNLPPGWAQGRQVVEVAGSNYSAQTIYGGSSNFSRIANRVFAPTTAAYTPWYEVMTSNTLEAGPGIALAYSSATGKVTIGDSTGWGANLALDNTNVNASMPTQARVVQASNRGKPTGTAQDGYYIRYSYIQGAGAYAVEQYAELSSITPRWFTRGTVNGVLPADWLEYITSQSFTAGSGISVSYSATTGKVTIASSASSSAPTASIATLDLTVGRGTTSVFNSATGEYAATIGPVGLGITRDTPGPASGRVDLGDISMTATGTGAGLMLGQMSGNEGQYNLTAGFTQWTGTLATGVQKVAIVPDYVIRPVLSDVSTIGRIRVRSRLFSFQVSTSAQRYLSAPIVINEVSSTPSALLSVSWVDSVNSGNIVITYRNNSGTTSTINTTIAPTYSAVRELSVDILWTGSTWEAKIYYGPLGVPSTLATITDFCFISNLTTARVGVESSITKSVGTTARYFTVHGLAMEILKR